MKTCSLVLVAAMASSARLAPAATFTAINTNSSGAGSLRQAILDANASVVPDRIEFAIPPFDGAVKTISPTSALPAISNPVVIDGYTQPGASTNTLADADDAVLLIELEGSRIVELAVGLNITAGNSSVRGLVINRFNSHGINLGSTISEAGTNVIEGNFIGADPTGTTARPNAGQGITVSGGKGNTIGGTMPAARNLISGNRNRGIFFFSGSRNIIQGNFIGIDRHGTNTLGNAAGGIDLSNANSGTNTIGGTSSAARNVISGNGGSGIDIIGASGNVIQGNLIGTDATGTKRLPNTLHGVLVTGSDNTFGGAVAGAGNLISGNLDDGIQINSGNGNRVLGNFIGTDVTGTLVLSNGLNGVNLRAFASNNFVGGAVAGSGNLISGNGHNGVEVAGALPEGVWRTMVQGNIIGADITGNNPLPNGDNGVRILTGRNMMVGGTNRGEGNRIVFNRKVGVSIGDFNIGNSTNQAILGNVIFANGGIGIDLRANGVGMNDVNDADTGPNWLQNFPVLALATDVSGGIQIQGTLNSTGWNSRPSRVPTA